MRNRWKIVEEYFEELYEVNYEESFSTDSTKFERALEIGRKAELKSLRRSAIRLHETVTTEHECRYYIRTAAKARLGRLPSVIWSGRKVLYVRWNRREVLRGIQSHL